MYQSSNTRKVALTSLCLIFVALASATNHITLKSEESFRLEQSTKVYKTLLDQYFDMFDRFLEGGRATVFSPNVMKCSQKIRNTSLAFNQTFVNYYNPKNANATMDKYVFNFTKVVSNNGSDAVGECYTTGFNFYSYILMRASQYKQFTTLMTSFLQNLIGNILNFNTIYQNIVNANNAGKYSDVYFYIGRLTYLIIYFDPIEDSPLFDQSSPLDITEYLLKGNAPTVQQTIGVFDMITETAMSFLNSSIGISSPNSTICISNITALNQSVTTLVNQFNLKLYDKMGPTLKRIVQSVDPITFACYYSGFEYVRVLYDYFLTIIDVNKLTYNIFHNAGRIYDATTDLIDNFRFGDYAVKKYWHRIGNDIGLIINQISYKPTNFDPYVKPNGNSSKKLNQYNGEEALSLF